MMDRRCSDCKRTLSSDEFYPKTRWPDGTPRTLYSVCRACGRLRVKAWRLANPEKSRANKRRQRERVQADRERAGALRAYAREWYRRRHNVAPEAYRTARGAQRLVDAAPVRDAIIRSGESCTVLGARAGLDESTVRKVLRNDHVLSGVASAILESLGLAPAEVGL